MIRKESRSYLTAQELNINKGGGGVIELSEADYLNGLSFDFTAAVDSLRAGYRNLTMKGFAVHVAVFDIPLQRQY